MRCHAITGYARYDMHFTYEKRKEEKNLLRNSKH